jgi:uncharacterized phage infection (PIP) family protein YhgE
MASAQNFRPAFNGFNREDVVHYIEYLNTKHTGAINQLKSENQTLADELEALRATPDLTEECAQLQEENQDLRTKIEELTAQIQELTQQLEEAQQVTPLADEELEAYRRAEKAERTARERARQIYCQATGALADATTQVDDAAKHFKILSQRINEQLGELQATVDKSKTALQDAAATMYTIRPSENENL